MNANFHLHPPKTGGSSIITALLEHSESFKEKYGDYYKKQVYVHYSPVTIPVDTGDSVTLGIRDPYERLISLTRWINRQGIYETHYTLKKHFAEARRYSKIDWSEDHARFKNFEYKWAIQATLNDWENSVNEDCEVKLIRFENLVEDFQAIYPIELPHIHHVPEPVPFSHIQENFDSQETLDKFNTWYEKDFERYSYTMITDINDLYQKYQDNG